MMLLRPLFFGLISRRFSQNQIHSLFLPAALFLFQFLLPQSSSDLENLKDKFENLKNRRTSYNQAVQADATTNPETFLKEEPDLYKTESGDLVVIFKIKINPPYHINSSQPLDKALIPTTLKFDDKLNENWQVQVYYPEGVVRKLKGKVDNDTVVSLYEGEVKIKTRLSPRGDSIETESFFAYPFYYYLHFQPCTEEVCFFPLTYSNHLNNQLAFKSVEELSSLPLYSGVLDDISKKSTKGISFNDSQSLSWGWFVLLAIVGGFLLNLMPCVLPVVSLKIYSLLQLQSSFGQLSEEQYRNHFKKSLLFYLFGTVFTFLCLGVLVAVLKNLGEAVGWGFQFQNPYYLFAMIIMLLAVAYSLLEILDLGFNFGNTLLAKAGLSGSPPENQGESGVAVGKQMFLGFFTVVLATPCIAPFLGVAAGFALGQSEKVIIFFYLLIALGFIFPYLMLLFRPSLLKLLPRPGGWMGTFKKVLIFPLLATLVWLSSILGKVVDADLSEMTYYFLLGLAMLLFFLDKIISTQRFRLKRWVSLGLLVFAYLWFSVNYISPRLENMLSSVASTGLIETTNENSGDNWQNFSLEKLDSYKKSGRPILVHFTADWCLNCKVYEKVVLSTDKTKELFKRHNVVLLKADWTRENPVIYSEIRKLGRAGIPLDVLYYGDREVILPEVITYQQIENALQKMLK